MKPELVENLGQLGLQVRAEQLVIFAQLLQRPGERRAGAQEDLFELADHVTSAASTGECGMFKRARALSSFAMAAILLAASNASQAQAPDLQQRFEKKVQEYEAGRQSQCSAASGAILFAGDSQFYRWKTIHEDLPGYTLINRGIDSFQFPDLLRYFDRLVLPYEPRLIVLHVGGNDVHNGRTPAQVLADFQAFVARVRATAAGRATSSTRASRPGPGAGTRRHSAW